ncbi:MAG: carbonic anhydrase [Mesorhizobium sp.]|uniref:carbonic anhydrase n=1 Tax=Mesorhizobium sp. TaxID=1871066 RepID=UPI000FE6EA47|nr:carbonic anhydrase [Mesorhizobium sp.]RWA97237.1 MAG: carbonic anhydrase [Mesorhizobium sp.]RWO23539.1 MAG: carbonic anhydrase [Mesorhizobium sp.]TIL84388.1 MAG: carbonic anhydrase [Mesorhizobium sp.]TIN47167.1 MAG: carbonic anhydrase [Mesorhizobium sp.]
MHRRNLIKGFVALGGCAISAEAARAASTHWGYAGPAGPEHWGDLDERNFVCSAGTQQSPIDVKGAIKADIPQIAIGWHKGGGRMVNNGHTIQVNLPQGSTLTRGDRVYDLLQFHFHAPSEHHVAGRNFPMEAHFVHKDADSDTVGVLGVFLTPGATNASFASLAAAFPATSGEETAVDEVDPNEFLPASLAYWTYEGSLTTPPCTENVEWMVAMEPVDVDPADMERFTSLYPLNARPIRSPNRRFILGLG